MQTTILNEAAEVIYDREAVHGDPENSFRMIAALWSAYLGVDVDAADIAHLMVLLKIARTLDGHADVDNYRDMAGYAECAAKLLVDDAY